MLPRIQEILRREALQGCSNIEGLRTAPSNDPFPGGSDTSDAVLLKNDRIYHHKLVRFHFTTYDVRRAADIINAGTTRCNIMLLADETHDSDHANPHHFLYARVLGAYHTNVIYTGPGMRDYEARRLDFLWVRWYEVVDPQSSGWDNLMLDSVHFPPMREDDAFGFIDPKDVLRTCHILPNFAKGKRHANGAGVSRCAKDSTDYKRYYIGRWVQLPNSVSALNFQYSGFLSGIL